MSHISLTEEKLSESVIGAFYEVYHNLGFGFLEIFYVLALERELRECGHRVDREVVVEIRYKGLVLGKQRLDMIVDEKLVVETKSTPQLHKAATRQLFNYLRATKLEVGLLLHFGPDPRFNRVVSQRPRITQSSPRPSGASAILLLNPESPLSPRSVRHPLP